MMLLLLKMVLLMMMLLLMMIVLNRVRDGRRRQHLTNAREVSRLAKLHALESWQVEVEVQAEPVGGAAFHDQVSKQGGRWQRLVAVRRVRDAST